MHRARLAYLAARAQGHAKSLWEVFGELLKKAKESSTTPKQVDSVCDFAEAVVAYHKFFEESRKQQRTGR
jgi:CRISPR type III-A-associated protein Csm2